MIISENEEKLLSSISQSRIVDCMEKYLIEGYGTMADVEKYVFPNISESVQGRTVSVIHRGYNFHGTTKGKYRKGCSFESQYDYEVTRKDLEAFVKKYPHGVPDESITFEKFLLDQIQKGKKGKTASDASSVKTKPISNVPGAKATKNTVKKTTKDEGQNASQHTERFRIGNVWDTGGFRKLIISLISVGISFIPFIITVYEMIWIRSHKGTSPLMESLVNVLFNKFGGMKGVAFLFWIIPFILFFVNGGIHLIYKLFVSFKGWKTIIKEIVAVVILTIFFTLAIFAGECIISGIFIVVRVIKKDFSK